MASRIKGPGEPATLPTRLTVSDPANVPPFDSEALSYATWGESERDTFDRAVIENSMNAVIACDEHGSLVVFNPTAREWLGLDARLISLEAWASYYRLYLPDGVTPCPAEEIPLARAFHGEIVRDVHMVIRAEGQAPRYVSCGGGPFFNQEGDKTGAFVVMVDRTEIHKLTAELEHLASHDVLTGLPNRRTFEAEVDRATRFALRGVVSTLLFADVDRFKTCNDLLGHGVGDRVLREIALCLKAAVRRTDMVARLGGDEFGLVLWDQTGDDVEQVSRRLEEAVSAVGRSHGLDIGLSIGTSVIAADSDAIAVLAEADVEMYRAKGADRRRAVSPAHPEPTLPAGPKPKCSACVVRSIDESCV